MKKTDFFHLQILEIPHYLLLLFLFLGSSLSLTAQCTVKTLIVNDVECFGDNTGSITLVMEGAVAPLSYTWAGPTAGQLTGQGDSVILNSLLAGDYSITITDATTCSTVTTSAIGTPPELLFNAFSFNPSCNGGSDGGIGLNIIGGTPPYQFFINDVFSGVGANPSQSGLTGGTYVLRVEDANQCSSAEQTIIIDEPTAISVILSDIVNPSCGMTTTGMVTVQAFGGTAPYIYNLNGAVPTPSPTFNGLSAGVYTVVVTDNNGCTEAIDFILSGNNNPELQTIASNQWLGCDSGCFGQVEAFAQCGSPPYTIIWSDPSYNGEYLLSDLCAGSYAYTITDDAGASVSNSFTVTPNPSLQVSTTALDPACSNSCDGEAVVAASSGRPPYTYLWSNQEIVTSIYDLCGGTYTVTVTDANGCTGVSSVTLEMNPITVQMEVNDVNCQEAGSIYTTTSGGVPSYIYLWSNGATTDSLVNLEAGTYILTITDQNGCTFSQTATINAPIQLAVSSTAASCDSIGGSATVSILGTVANPSYEWSSGGTSATETNLAPGWYSVTVTDTDNDCRVHRNVQVPLADSCFVRISGYVYLDDINQDCTIDSTTVGIPNIMVTLDNGDVTFTDLTGYYEFNPLPGNYTVNLVLNTPQYASLCTSPISISAPNFGGIHPDNHFYLKYDTERNLVLKISKSNARPGFIHSVRICVMNRGAQSMDGTLTFVHDPLQEFQYSIAPETSYKAASQTLKWDFTDHPAGVTYVYKVFFKVPIGTALGTPLDMYFKVDPIVGDSEPWNNEESCILAVTGSYDPNDKQVSPMGEGEEGNISRQDSILSYHIRFQNTGTDTAFTVVIRDTLDDNLDVNTIVPGPASHDYRLTVLKGNILEFTFDNILLPDSFINESASNGFVFFDIQLKKGLDYGASVSNTAAIFFDFNEPVITNTVKNTLKMPTGLFGPEVEAIGLELLPNPNAGKGLLRYQLDQAERVRIRLFDAQGRKIKELQSFTPQAAGAHQLAIDAFEQQPGIYFIHLETAEGRSGIIRWIYMK